MKPRLGILLFLLTALLIWPHSARSSELTAALSSHLVGITTGFTGSEVLVFGAVSGEGDIIIVARGPENPEVVRRKARKAGIWVNDTEMVFENVPGFYAVASSRPLADILSDAAGEEFEIGVNNVILEPKDGSNASMVDGFRDALVRNKQKIDLYSEGWAPVRFLGTLLFRSDLDIPSNAPVGAYTIAVHLVRDGVVTDSSISPLSINRIGFEARVFDFAHRNSFAYGVLAILIAAMAGWLANWVFRKG